MNALDGRRFHMHALPAITLLSRARRLMTVLVICALGYTLTADEPSQAVYETRRYEVTSLLTPQDWTCWEERDIQHSELLPDDWVENLSYTYPGFDRCLFEGDDGQDSVFSGNMGLRFGLPDTWNRFAPEGLTGLITQSVAPETWDGTPAECFVRGTTLVVHHQRRVLAHIEALLDALMAERARRYRLDIAQVPIASLPERVSYLMTGDAFEAACRRAGTACARVSVCAHDDQPLLLRDQARNVTSAIYGVDQTGAFPKVSTYAYSRALGTSFRVRLRSIAYSDSVRVFLDVCQVTMRKGPDMAGTPFGPLDASWYDRTRLTSEMVTPPGMTALAGFMEGTLDGVGRRAVLVRVTGSAHRPWLSYTPPGEERFLCKLYDIQFLIDRAETLTAAQAGIPSSPARLIEFMARCIAPGSWDREEVAWYANDCAALIRQTPQVHEAISRQFATWTHTMHVMATIHTWLYEGDTTQVRKVFQTGPSLGALPGDWEHKAGAAGLDPVLRSRLTGSLDRYHTLEGFTHRQYVAGADTIEVSSLGRSLSHCLCLHEDSAGAGSRLEVKVSSLTNTLVALDLMLETAATSFDAEMVARIPCRKMLSTPPAERPADRLPLKPQDRVGFVPVEIQLPRGNARKQRHRIVLTRGTPTLIECRCEGATAQALVVQVDVVSAASP